MGLQRIREPLPRRVRRLRSQRAPRPRKRPGPRAKLRTSSTTKYSWTKSASTRSARKCPRFCVSRDQLSWKNSRLMDLSLELSLHTQARQVRPRKESRRRGCCCYHQKEVSLAVCAPREWPDSIFTQSKFFL